MSETNCPTPGKSRHTSKRAAFVEIRHKGTAIKPYHCVCGAWHVGHFQPHLKKRE